MSLLDKVINRYLSLDPEMSARLEAFDGKIIAIEVVGTGKTFYLAPQQGKLKLRHNVDEQADTTLRGSPMALFKMGMADRVAPMLLKGDIEITGDIRLGREFKQVLADMDIDWEEQLSTVLGDATAFRAMSLARKVTTWGQQAVDSFAGDVSEYLQEESRDVVTGAELEDFYQQVDRLRDDVDRLQARIETLKQSGNRDGPDQ